MSAEYEWVELGFLCEDGTVQPRGKRAHRVLRKRENKACGFTLCSLRGRVVTTKITKPKCKLCTRSQH